MADEGSSHDISIIDRDLIGPTSGYVTLILALNGAPDADWLRFFFNRPGTSRTGSVGYLHGPAPKVEGAKVSWRVPSDDMEDAFLWIRSAVDFANSQYSALIGERTRQADELLEKQRLTELKDNAQHEELKRLLDSF